MLQRGDGLVIVDVQNDFLPGGALGVPHGDEVIAPLNRCCAAFAHRGLPIFASRDWHPADHCSFSAQGGPWPPHCIRDTRGAELASQLHLPPCTQLVSKATRSDADAYSAFQGTDLTARLQRAGCRRVIIGGLATDYCVKATVLDARGEGFEVLVLCDAVRAVDVHAGDGERALAEMHAAGAELGTVAALLEAPSGYPLSAPGSPPG